MSRDHKLICYVPAEIGTAFIECARQRDVAVSAALRQLVVRSLQAGTPTEFELRQNLLFQTIALDGLLQTHFDRELRARVLKNWRDRLAEEGLTHAA